MSSAQSPESRLKALQCHFTWDLNPKEAKLHHIKQNLEDIGTEEGNIWLGHIYNLLGFIHYKLGSMEEARGSFSRATQAFQQLKSTDEGPWLVVNYGNLAWLHHHTGEDEKSQDFLSKVDALMDKYPSPFKEELHPEVCAEKAWTLMKFEPEKKLQAAEYFQKAVRMEPDRKPWRSSFVLLKLDKFKNKTEELDDEVFTELTCAKEEDPENLYLQVLYMEASAAKGRKLEKQDVQDLAERVLSRSASRYNGLAPLLRLYRKFLSVDEAVVLAEEALRRHPGARSVIQCAAVCYKYKVFFQNPDSRTLIRAASLFERLIEVYPHFSMITSLNLADIYSKISEDKAGQIYKKLLENQEILKDLEPFDAQMFYYRYANHLYFIKKQYYESLKNLMKVVEIPHQSYHREKSLTELKKAIKRNKNSEICEEIEEFLEKMTLKD